MTSYTICLTCGRMTQGVTGFCNYCHAPLPNFLRPPKLRHAEKDILLGYLSNGKEFHLPLNQLGYHFSFFGVTGSGKTRLAMKLAIEAENRGMKLLILDIEGEWKNIIPYLAGKTEYYEVETNLKVNPFDIGDIGLARHLLKETIFKGIEVEYRDLSPQMNYVFDKCLEKSMNIPELLDNIVYFQPELPFKLSNLDRTKTALVVRLEPYRTNRVLKDIFYCYNSSVNLRKLSDKNILIDLHALEAKVAYRVELRLIYNTIAVACLKEALSRRTTDKTSHMFIADEAQMLAPKILRKIVVTDTWATTDFATRLRKRGESLVVITQSPNNIEDDIRRNAQNGFVFRLQDPEDIRLIGGSIGITTNTSLDYFSNYLANLDQRRAIVKTPLTKDAFMITAPDISLKRISRKELRKYLPKERVELDEEEQFFLQSLESHPFISMVERRRMLGFNKRTYSKVVKRLVDRGVIEKVRVPVGVGRPIVLYQRPGKTPSIKHEYYVHWLIEELAKKGLICQANKKGPDIEIPSLNTAINVELGKSKIQDNIEIALNKFKRIIVCSDKKNIIKNLSQKNTDHRILISDVWAVPDLF